jgi:hypothetical protein
MTARPSSFGRSLRSWSAWHKVAGLNAGAVAGSLCLFGCVGADAAVVACTGFCWLFAVAEGCRRLVAGSLCAAIMRMPLAVVRSVLPGVFLQQQFAAVTCGTFCLWCYSRCHDSCAPLTSGQLPFCSPIAAGCV